MLVQLRMKSVSIRTICPFHDPVNLFFCATGPKLTPVSEECVSLPVSVCIYQKRRDRPGEDWEYSGELRQLAHCVSILVQPVQVRRRGAGRVPPPAPMPRLRGFPHTSAPFYVSAGPAGACAGLLRTRCQKKVRRQA